MSTTKRRAQPGELCTCGRPATVVYLTENFGEIGHCGVADGGDRSGPCPFCGAPDRHTTSVGDQGRCPQYRVRPSTGGDR